jgi:hypothetical protein
MPTIRISYLWALNVPGSSVELPGLKSVPSNYPLGQSWLATDSEDGVRLWPLRVAHLVEVFSPDHELVDREDISLPSLQ